MLITGTRSLSCTDCAPSSSSGEVTTHPRRPRRRFLAWACHAKTSGNVVGLLRQSARGAEEWLRAAPRWSRNNRLALRPTYGSMGQLKVIRQQVTSSLHSLQLSVFTQACPPRSPCWRRGRGDMMGRNVVEEGHSGGECFALGCSSAPANACRNTRFIKCNSGLSFRREGGRAAILHHLPQLDRWREEMLLRLGPPTLLVWLSTAP